MTRFCDRMVPEFSVYAVLHRERDRLFPTPSGGSPRSSLGAAELGANSPIVFTAGRDTP